MIHRRFLEAAALSAAAAAVLAVAAGAGMRVTAAQLALTAGSTLVLAACAAWYAADGRRAIGEAAHGHVALALPGALTLLAGAVGTAAGLPTAAPAIVIGAVAIVVALLVLVKRIAAGTRDVQRSTTVTGTGVVTTDYRVAPARSPSR